MTGVVSRLGAARGQAVADLIDRRVEEEPHLRPLYDAMTDEQTRVHEGEEHATEGLQYQRGLRYFHAWRVDQVRRRMGDRLGPASVLDVGDTDGLILRDLGKSGTGFNLSPVAIENIRSNGVEAVLGDGHGMPFDDASFDVVLCFETLEHVESPAQVLDQLARVCRPDGRVFVSIPWVPRTYVHARDTAQPRGHQHIFEFSRKDFLALVSHTGLEPVSDDVCRLLGHPRTPAEWGVVAESRANHLVAGMFHRFQFFELRPRA